MISGEIPSFDGGSNIVGFVHAPHESVSLKKPTDRPVTKITWRVPKKKGEIIYGEEEAT